jgi:hypothetical protein
MATMLEECTTEEQCSIVHVLWAKGLNAKDIHKEIFSVYSGSVCHLKQFITREEFLEAAFSVQSVPRLYTKDKWEDQS